MRQKFQTNRESSPQPTQIFADVQQLFADDPDPLFLEESWTLGIPAAVYNLHRRRHEDAEREHQSRAFRSPGSLGTLAFVEDREQAADRAATPAHSWTPQDWVPDDRIAQRWIPAGWTPAGVPPRTEAQQNPAPPCDLPMTEPRARHLLGVTPSSTREQIHSAYRRLVSQWHPDRLQLPSEAASRHATQQMAALNEAYRLLCEALLQVAA